MGLAVKVQVQVLLSASPENRLFLGFEAIFKRFFIALNGNDFMRFATPFCSKICPDLPRHVL